MPCTEAWQSVFGDAAPRGGLAPGPSGSAPHSRVRSEGMDWNQKQAFKSLGLLLAQCLSFPPCTCTWHLPGWLGAFESLMPPERDLWPIKWRPPWARDGDLCPHTHSALRLAGKHTHTRACTNVCTPHLAATHTHLHVPTEPRPSVSARTPPTAHTDAHAHPLPRSHTSAPGPPESWRGLCFALSPACFLGHLLRKLPSPDSWPGPEGLGGFRNPGTIQVLAEPPPYCRHLGSRGSPQAEVVPHSFSTHAPVSRPMFHSPASGALGSLQGHLLLGCQPAPIRGHPITHSFHRLESWLQPHHCGMSSPLHLRLLTCSKGV